MRHAILVNENNGVYRINPNAEPELWDNICNDHDTQQIEEVAEELLGWGEWRTAYMVTRTLDTVHYFVTDEEEEAANA